MMKSEDTEAKTFRKLSVKLKAWHSCDEKACLALVLPRYHPSFRLCLCVCCAFANVR